MSEFKPNEKLYEKLSKPVSFEQADGQLREFTEAVYKLRKKHKITDLVFIAVVNVEDDKMAHVVGQCGDRIKAVQWAEYAFRKLQMDMKKALQAIHDQIK